MLRKAKELKKYAKSIVPYRLYVSETGHRNIVFKYDNLYVSLYFQLVCWKRQYMVLCMLLLLLVLILPKVVIHLRGVIF